MSFPCHGQCLGQIKRWIGDFAAGLARGNANETLAVAIEETIASGRMGTRRGFRLMLLLLRGFGCHGPATRATNFRSANRPLH